MTLYFITGNENKFREVKAVLPDIERLDIDLPEIQHSDAHTILETKLEEAAKRYEGEFMVEDTSLYFDCLNGLPGPLIKWFLKHLGAQGLYDLCGNYGNYAAEARTVIGYSSKGNTRFFEGSTRGVIVAPEPGSTFGWDPIFRPEGYDVPYARLSVDEKNRISHRGKAARQLKEFLESRA